MHECPAMKLLLLCLLAWLSLSALPARAADPCPALRMQTRRADQATRIAAFACAENHAGFRSFIDADGRSSGQPVYEAENDALADGMVAWKKVARYWKDSGLSDECTTTATACRSFVIDTPWSAAFVSWVMRRAGVRGFTGSARHVDYVRAASRDTARSPYRIIAPDRGAPAAGDMLCYVRANARVIGYQGLLARMEGDPGLPMHCDIVVAAEPGGMAWLVGGNVQQAVTLRMLRLDERGYLMNLPLRTGADAKCSPDAPGQCNLNRQDWVALLKLRTDARDSMLATARG